MRPKVYVAGPYTHGDVAANVRCAIRAGDAIADAGGVPFIPHLTHFWHLLHGHDHAFWIEQDLAWLRCCDALLRLPGLSIGADQEVLEAERLGLPVFRVLAQCLIWTGEKV